MTINELFANKSLKPKEKSEILQRWLLDEVLKVDDLLAYAENSKDPVKGACIEALEYASKSRPKIVTRSGFQFLTRMLSATAPRVKWESAKVIGNSAHVHADQLASVIQGLLDNSEHEGTVVRWSAAFALGEILKLNTALNAELLPAIEAILQREEKTSIRKVYAHALKMVR